MTCLVCDTGDSPQRQPFSIPFSGQSDPFTEEDDDLFGADPSHQPGPFGAAAPVSAPLAPEPSFSFDDVDVQSQQQYGHQSLTQQDASSQGMSTHSGQQQQQPHQDAALWPEPQSMFQPQSESVYPNDSQYQSQSQSQYEFQGQAVFQPSLPSSSQTQAQFQGQPPSQASLFKPVQQPSYGQAQAPQVFVPHKSATQGHAPSAYCQSPSVPSLPFQQFPSAPPGLPFQQFPLATPGLPFQQQAVQPQAPWAHPAQSHLLNPSLPLQLQGRPLAVNTQRVSSPYAVDNASQSQHDLYGPDATWPGPDDAAALEQPQSQGQLVWPHQDPSAVVAAGQAVSFGSLHAFAS